MLVSKACRLSVVVMAVFFVGVGVVTYAGSAEEYGKSGLEHYEKGDYEKAIADYSEAIRLQPDEAKYFNNRGAAYHGQKIYDKAIADCNEAMRLKPEQAAFFTNRGTVYLSIRHYDRALTDFIEAIRLEPDTAENYGYRGVAYYFLKDYDNAIVDIEKALRLNSNQETFKEVLKLAQAENEKILVDSRDGRKYRTVNINKKIWMAENLNYKIGTSWCYDNNDSNCDRYGVLYDWNTAKKACPAGWHLPSQAEWADLVRKVGYAGAGKVLKSKKQWNGTDLYGWSALPGGWRMRIGVFGGIGTTGYYWSATGDDKSKRLKGAHSRMVESNSDKMKEIFPHHEWGLSVRCVKDDALSSSTAEQTTTVAQASTPAKPAAAQTSTFTDPRDGQNYRMVKIGTATWMAQNLNYVTDDSRCNNVDGSNCVTYGRLYGWDAAMAACPAGWRLPTGGDWENLLNTVGQTVGRSEAGKALKSKTGWNNGGNGDDRFGFSALANGFGRKNQLWDVGFRGFWWSATEVGTQKALSRSMQSNFNHVLRSNNNKTDHFAVRCIQNVHQ